jgi:hypothetical protein
MPISVLADEVNSLVYRSTDLIIRDPFHSSRPSCSIHPRIAQLTCEAHCQFSGLSNKAPMAESGSPTAIIRLPRLCTKVVKARYPDNNNPIPGVNTQPEEKSPIYIFLTLTLPSRGCSFLLNKLNSSVRIVLRPISPQVETRTARSAQPV